MVQLIGILNVTPDSFSDGGKFIKPDIAVQHAEAMFKAGANIVDIGAVSTRPNADPVGPEEEWRRLEPVLEVLIPKFPGQISLDSHNPETVEKALEIGPVIINDVTGLSNPEMIRVVLRFMPTIIISHLPGVDIQAAHKSEPTTTVEQVKKLLLRKANLLERGGVPRRQIILDPGIGFGKTKALNIELLKFGAEVPDYKVMIGYSKKRFLGEDRMNLETNLRAGRTAIENGAAYLRVHDIAEHAQLI